MKISKVLDKMWDGIGFVFSAILITMLTSFVVLAVYACIWGILYMHKLLAGGV